jgi:DNA-binding SARP family transcriptional activator
MPIARGEGSAHLTARGKRPLVAVGPGRPDEASPVPSQAPQEYPVQRSKVQRPPLRDETLARDRLLGWLAAKSSHRVILVSADAGYGKTTLLADFARRTRLRVLWYRIDEEDADWVAVLNYLVAAGREVEPTFGTRTLAMLRDLGSVEVGRDDIVESLVQDVAALGSAPTLFILDDFHHLDRVPDLRAIVRELVHRAPERLTFVFSSRQRPTLGLARLRAAGEVVELTTEDLRFNEDETERLFRESYGRPLEPDVLTELRHRTEGWAASLQLTQTALRDRTGSDVRHFVQRLTGAWDGLYDYLAEEVVGDLDVDTQRFLMRTSILGVVAVELASIASGFDIDRAGWMIDEAERLGLLARRGETASHSYRYHPLVRDFLEDRLRREEGESSVAELHRKVALATERRDWRVAAHHYAVVGDLADLHRLIAGSLDTILANGDFAAAEGFLTRHPPSGPDPLFEVILSRRDFYEGRPERAVTRARAASGALPPEHLGSDAALVNLASLEYMAGQGHAVREIAPTLREHAGSPTIAEIGTAMELLVAAADDGSIGRLADHLASMVKDQEARGETHYLAVTLVNLAVCHRAQAAPTRCLDVATRAIALLDGGDREPELAAALGCRAWAYAWLGRWPEAIADLRRADLLRNEYARAELLTEGIDLYTWFDATAGADELLARIRTLRGSPVTQEDARLARAELAIRRGWADVALEELDGPSLSSTGVAHQARFLGLRGHALLVAGSSEAPSALDDAIRHARSQGADLHAAYAALLRASIEGPDILSATIVEIATTTGPAALSMVAERLPARAADLSESGRAALAGEAERRPGRWRDPIRDLVEDRSTGASRLFAAELLELIGDRDDVPRLRSVAREGRSQATVNLGRTLARRLAVPVYVEDQGRVEIRIGSVVVGGSRIRRRVLALFCYLLSRSGLSATREQVVDTLWPDLDPAVAINSLNQSVYFLRRIFEPGVRDDLSAGYVHQDQDLVWLDRELITSRSVECREIIRAMGPEPGPEEVEELSRAYRGSFAMDFEYEDWAADYRSSLHARYLQIIEHAVSVDLVAGQYERASAWARRALDVDPGADAIEAMLVRLYRRSGAHAAAASQYAHYAAVLRDQLGVEPPAIDLV